MSYRRLGVRVRLSVLAFILFGAAWEGSLALADDRSALDSDDMEGAYLDAPYTHLKPAVDDTRIGFGDLLDLPPFLYSRSDTKSLIAKQTPVRSQGARGTCAIFSATAMLESMRVIKGQATVDQNLSEEWLEYLVARNKTSDGSAAPDNYLAMIRYGFVSEESFPYIGEDWTKVPSSLSDQRCGHVPEHLKKGCLLAHRDPRLLEMPESELSSPSSPFYDPEFQDARREGFLNRATYMSKTSSRFWVSNLSEVKQLLSQGLPVVLESDFFYGAWNHRKAADLGIGRNMDHWSRGIVGYPEPGSKDRKISLETENRTGHSIQIVGYDDNVVVRTTVQMMNGSVREFAYKGVYYFKNSWGTSGFGNQFTLEGNPYPGYGMITYKYAHELGAFYRLPLDDLK